MNRKLLVLPALLGALTPVITGCGSSGGGSGGSGKPIVVGTTDNIELTKDSPAPLDPATKYDAPTWNVFYNTFQMLLTYQRGSTTPTPDAAKECHYADTSGLTYQCTMRAGQEFSNGHPLTSDDVKFSIDRMKKIKWSDGPSSLISDVNTVDAPDPQTVVFHLKQSDATFPAKLATPAAAIVDSKVYPADKPYTGWRLVGSGPYQLDSFTQGKQAVFTKNKHYGGTLKMNNSAVTLKMFADSDKMEAALKDGQLDVMTRQLAPNQIQALQSHPDPDFTLTESPGGQARYLFLNTKSSSLKDVAVRQAMAKIVDRDELTRDVYQRTAVPLYSVVPQGITGHVNSFYDLYGAPNVSAAKSTLHKAGIDSKVPLTISFNTDSGGTKNQAEADDLKKQLDASGLFDVSLKSMQFNALIASAAKGQYQAFAINWLPDFPDPDNYIAPFFDKETFLPLPFSIPQIRDTILPETRKQAERSATTDAFGQAQKIVAQQVPMLPLWQAKQYIAARNDITGAEWALNSQTTMQFWELGRGASG